jgi:predicted DNA-binding transcriptional regulator YafY
MTRSARLLKLMDLLRGRRRPVTAATLAGRLSVSERTVYRDIQALAGLGADIAGSAGVGYSLRSGFFLPPLMFSDDEIEALVLGARWVAGQGDASLAAAADSALAKVATSSPRDLREKIAEIGLFAPRAGKGAPGGPDLGPIRTAIREEHKLRIGYVDAAGKASERIVWPIAVGFFEGVRVFAGWCELRRGFRHFRIDRIATLERLAARYPTPRRELVRSWRQALKHA